jgi:uncharacterized membrane protein YczE
MIINHHNLNVLLVIGTVVALALGSDFGSVPVIATLQQYQLRSVLLLLGPTIAAIGFAISLRRKLTRPSDKAFQAFFVAILVGSVTVGLLLVADTFGSRAPWSG